MPKQAYVYLLESTSNLKKGIYCGFTVDPEKRLRKHNGELKGGAKYTRAGRPWRILAYVTTSAPWFDYTQARILEWCMKRTKKWRKAAGTRKKGSTWSPEIKLRGHTNAASRLQDLFWYLNRTKRWSKRAIEYKDAASHALSVSVHSEFYATDVANQIAVNCKYWAPHVSVLQ